NVATLLTGVSPLAHGLGLRPGRVLGPRRTTLAQAAAWAGVTTCALGNTGVVGPDTGLDRGYETVHTARLPAGQLVERAVDWLADAGQFRWFLTLHLDDLLAPHEPPLEDLLAVTPEPDPALVERLRPL